MRYDRTLGAFSEKHNAQYYTAQADTTTCIIFNGEIYNFLELKQILVDLWYAFSTQTDTEVILASYLEWWTECVKKFNGMRAFAIHNPSDQSIFMSRDTLGEKPFYYYLHENGIARGSEIKSILPHLEHPTIDTEALDFYFTIGYIPAPRSVYTQIRKLPAHHSLVYNYKDMTCVIEDYFQKPEYNPSYDKQALIDEGRALLKDATKYRMFADVPVGAFLSWGLDSSSVVAEMTTITDKSKLHTFSIWFEGKYDESEYINIVKDAFGTVHHHAYFKQEHFEERLDDLSTYYDEPFADYSNFPTSFVCELARKHVTVSLSGDGGDEIFGGYMMHQVAAQMAILYRLPTRCKKLGYWMLPHAKDNLSLLWKMKEALRVAQYPPEEFYAQIGGSSLPRPAVYQQWTITALRELLAINKGNFIQAMIDFDLYYNTLSDNFLTKVDRASMRVALEVRPPFLDPRFIAFGHKIPTKWKVNRRITKILMRDIITWLVPEQIVHRGKKGFQPPIDKRILQSTYTTQIEQALETLSEKGLVSKERETFYRDHVLQKNNSVYNTYKIKLLLLRKRYQTWL